MCINQSVLNIKKFVLRVCFVLRISNFGFDWGVVVVNFRRRDYGWLSGS
jgi:hypothetical protein